MHTTLYRTLSTVYKVRLRYASRGAHLYFMCYDSEPVYPGPHPSRKDGLLAQDPKGGDGDRELLRFSKRRCEIEPGARDAPTSAREVQAQGCKVSASKESARRFVLVCLSLGRSCPVPGCSSWASRFASRAP